MSPSKSRKKPFDCVEFKRKAQARIYEETKGLTRREQIEYFNRKALTGPVGKWWKNLRRFS